ncbi:hypothetical protein ACJX0J_036181 [Zea mays]
MHAIYEQRDILIINFPYYYSTYEGVLSDWNINHDNIIYILLIHYDDNINHDNIIYILLIH